MMDLRRLRLLRELEARGTIAAVAESLSFSPSAVSQQLARLEREVDVTLLERVGRGVRLTDAARTLVAHTEALLARMDMAEADLARSAGDIRGTLRVATFQTAGIALLPPAAAALAAAHPLLEIELRQAEPEDALPALVRGDVDLVVADEYDASPRPRHRALEREELCSDRLRVVLPADDPRAAGGDPVTLSSLAERSWAVGRPSSSYSQSVVRACNELGGFDPVIRHHASDLLILLALVRAGRAVALLPDLLGADGSPGVAVRSIAEGTVERAIYSTVRLGSERRPSVAALRNALSDAALKPSTVLDWSRPYTSS